MFIFFSVAEEPLKVLEDLLNLENNTKVRETYASWLLQFPSQCVLVAETIMWERQVHKALEKQDRLELIAQR